MSVGRLVFTVIQRVSIYVADSIANDTRHIKAFRRILYLPVGKAYLWLERKHSYWDHRRWERSQLDTDEATIELGAKLMGVLLVRAYILSAAGIVYLMWLTSQQEKVMRKDSLEFETLQLKRQLYEMQLSCQEKAIVVRRLKATADALTLKVKEDIRRLREEEEMAKRKPKRLQQVLTRIKEFLFKKRIKEFL